MGGWRRDAVPTEEATGMINFGHCLGARESYPPEEQIYEEDLAIARCPSSCVQVITGEDGTELLKITCRPDRPVVYRVCELDFASLTYTLRFPD